MQTDKSATSIRSGKIPAWPDEELNINSTTLIAVLTALAICSSVLLGKNTDFQVYWFGIRDYFMTGRALYGPLSGVFYPQEFRYPPVSVLFLLPFTFLPFKIAGICFNLLAWVTCIGVSVFAIRTWSLTFSKAGAAVTTILMFPYVLLAVKFGNVQSFLIALIFVAFLWSERRPGLAGLAFAIAISFKLWPLFFVPWFLTRPRRAMLYYTLGASAILWTAPALFFGFDQYLALLRDCFSSAFALASRPEKLWYSSQSLRGVLIRFFTPPVRNADGYPAVSIATLPISLAVGGWLVLSIPIYGWAVVSSWRADRSRRFLWDAASFVCYSALQPFCMTSSLISLWPAILAAGHVYSNTERFGMGARPLFLVATGLSALASMTFYRPLQRETVMLGIHFWIMLALGIGLLLAARTRPNQA